VIIRPQVARVQPGTFLARSHRGAAWSAIPAGESTDDPPSSASWSRSPGTERSSSRAASRSCFSAWPRRDSRPWPLPPRSGPGRRLPRPR